MNFYFQRERDQWEIDLDDDNKEKEVTAYMQWYFSDADGLKTMSVASIRTTTRVRRSKGCRTEGR